MLLFRNPISLYPNVGLGVQPTDHRHSTSTTDLDKLNKNEVNAYTIKSPLNGSVKGIDGVPFRLSPSLANALNKKVSLA